MKKGLFLLGLIIIFSVHIALSQYRWITGTVTESNGTLLAGAHVVVKGTCCAAITELNGRFSVKVSSDTSLVTITFIGMNKSEIIVGQEKELKVILHSPAIAYEQI
jgi:hypothetical protein